MATLFAWYVLDSLKRTNSSTSLVRESVVSGCAVCALESFIVNRATSIASYVCYHYDHII